MAETGLEYIGVTIEAVKGTPSATPAKFLNAVGVLTPREVYYEPDEARGWLTPYARQARMRTWGDWSARGPLDTDVMPYLLNAAVDIVAAPAIPGGAVNTRLWEFIPDIDADTIEALTIFHGDPNTKIFRATYGLAQQLMVRGDASSVEAPTMEIRGIANTPIQMVAAPALPSQTYSILFSPLSMQVWLDTGLGIGTTEVTGRVVSAESVLMTDIQPKWIAIGPAAANRTYARHGRGKKWQTVTKVTFELRDMTQYDLMANATRAKLRVRYSGGLIELAFYDYVEVDTYGPLRMTDWGVLSGTNRTITLEMHSDYDATLGAGFRWAVQNDNVAL